MKPSVLLCFQLPNNNPEWLAAHTESVGMFVDMTETNWMESRLTSPKAVCVLLIYLITITAGIIWSLAIHIVLPERRV